jgi:site-specific recombinase XerD
MTQEMHVLELYFDLRAVLERRRCGPLAPHMDSLASALHKRGYARQTARQVLVHASSFSRYLEQIGIRRVTKINEVLVGRFLRSLTSKGSYADAPRAMRIVLAHLRRCAAIPEAPTCARVDPHARLLERYNRYLRDVLGVSPGAQQDYCRGARLLVEWLRLRRRTVSSLRASDILRFVTELAGRHSTRSWRNRITSQPRVFLRFLHWEGTLAADLARVIPKLPCWRLTTIPRHVPWSTVRKMIDSIDASHARGKRDKAVVLLVAILGMRGEEVRTLKLSDIAWRSGEIRLPRTKSQRAKVLPLPREVGAALADYVLHGRPRFTDRHVILRHAAPLGPLASPSAVGRIISRPLRRMSVAIPERPGVHLLRHSLATRMVNVGVPIKQIADLFGHRSINTTAIYTKVDLTHLSEVALPFPGTRAKK